MRINWKELVKKHENEIYKSLKDIFERACVAEVGDFRLIYSVILDADGNVRTRIDTSPNSYDRAVWEGKAIYIAEIKEFTPWEHSDEAEWILPYLETEEKEGYLKFCEEEYFGEISFASLKAYSTKLYQKIANDAIDDYVYFEADVWANNCLASLLQELERFDPSFC